MAAAHAESVCLQSLGEDDDPLSDAAGSSWKQYFEDQEGLEQIQRDVERTHQGVPFFADPDAGCEKHQQVRSHTLWPQRARPPRVCAHG